MTTASTVLSDADLERLELDVRADLIGAIDRLARLRAADAHTRRGHATWHEYVEARFGDLIAELRLPVEERRELVLSMRTHPTAPASQRAIAAKLGVGLGTVSDDLRQLREAGRLDAEPVKVVGRDGVQRPARGDARPGADTPPAGGGADVAPLGPPVGLVYQQAAEWLRRAADGVLPGFTAGLTLVELAAVAGWTEGKASGALSYLTKPSRGLAVRLEEARAGQRVHVLTDGGLALLERLAAERDAAAAVAVTAVADVLRLVETDPGSLLIVAG